jgi:hypothetical protein
MIWLKYFDQKQNNLPIPIFPFYSFCGYVKIAKESYDVLWQCYKIVVKILFLNPCRNFTKRGHIDAFFHQRVCLRLVTSKIATNFPPWPFLRRAAFREKMTFGTCFSPHRVSYRSAMRASYVVGMRMRRHHHHTFHPWIFRYNQLMTRDIHKGFLPAAPISAHNRCRCSRVGKDKRPPRWWYPMTTWRWLLPRTRTCHRAGRVVGCRRQSCTPL